MFPAWVTSDVINVDEGVGQLGGILPRGVLQIAVSPCGFSSCILVKKKKKKKKVECKFNMGLESVKHTTVLRKLSGPTPAPPPPHSLFQHMAVNRLIT